MLLLEVLRVLWSGRNQPFESFGDFDLLLVGELECSRFSITDQLGSLVVLLFVFRLRDLLALIELVRTDALLASFHCCPTDI